MALNILPLNWEAETEQVTTKHEEGEVVSEQQAALDLLDMPVYTAGSVKAVDDRGAQASIDQRQVLKTVIAENFYAVHSKAQARVPVPEGLNLDAPFQLQALNDLLNVEIEENLSVHALHFVPPLKSVQEAGDHQSSNSGVGSSSVNRTNNYYSDEPSKDLKSNSSYTDAFEASVQPSGGGRSKEDGVFMLGGGSDSKQDNSIIPLSKILGDNFQDSSSGGKKSKRSKGSKSGSKVAKNVNMVDLLPAGFEASDDEAVDTKKKKAKSKKTRGGAAGDYDEDNVSIVSSLILVVTISRSIWMRLIFLLL